MMDDRLAQAAELHREGVAAAQRGQYEPARQFMRRALEVGGGLHAPAERGLIQRNLAEVNRRLGRTQEAVAAGQAAVRLLGADAGALLNLGVALADAGQDGSALACFDEALAIEPDMAAAHFGRAEILLRRGDMAAGWAEYAWRTLLPGVAPQVPAEIAERAWGGAAGAATLLVIADQGFGDMIFFARFLPWAAARCWRLVVHAPRAVHGLLAAMAGTATLIDDWRDAPPAGAWCRLADLPRLGAVDAACALPYVTVPAQARARWRAALDEAVPPAPGRRRVGLVWAGQGAQANDYARSVPLQRLAPLAEADDVDWVSLQKGDAALQRGAWPRPMADYGAVVEDFADTAAVLSLLDRVITVDTSVAHLAGAMGASPWVLLRHRADWRWGDGSAGSPWYPSARLFRQPHAGDWDAVAASVRAALADGA